MMDEYKKEQADISEKICHLYDRINYSDHPDRHIMLRLLERTYKNFIISDNNKLTKDETIFFNHFHKAYKNYNIRLVVREKEGEGQIGFFQLTEDNPDYVDMTLVKINNNIPEHLRIDLSETGDAVSSNKREQ